MKKQTNQLTSRFDIIDQVRGIAVILMVFFHTSYDLTAFGYLNIDFSEDKFWYFLPRLIVFLFLFCVGASLSLAHIPQIKWKKYWPRLLKITLFALSVSVTTYLMFPSAWVFFGTLHCIALTSLMALPFLKLPKTALVIALALFIPSIFFNYNLPWFTMGHKSMDYIAPFPWFGAVCLGIFAFHYNFHKINAGRILGKKYLSLLGIHALWIYILHQPIIYGIVFGFYTIFHK